MKKLSIAALMLCMCISLAACSQKDPVTGYRSGDVKLGQYKGVTYSADVINVTEDQVIERYTSELLANNMVDVPVEDRDTVEYGDNIILDYVGKMDGVEFDGGSAYGMEFTVGSMGFIPGFEEALVGAKLETPFSFDVTFPESYGKEELAGKPATFECNVHGIFSKDYPELTDELVAANTEYETVDDYRDYLYTEIENELIEQANASKEYQVFKKIIAESKFDDGIAAQISTNAAQILAQQEQTAQTYYGVSAVQFYNLIYDMTEDDILEYAQATAKMNIKYSFVLSAIAEAEGCEATDAEIDALAIDMMNSYGYETVDELIDLLTENYGTNGRKVIASQVKLNKARDIVMDSAVDGEV